MKKKTITKSIDRDFCLSIMVLKRRILVMGLLEPLLKLQLKTFLKCINAEEQKSEYVERMQRCTIHPDRVSLTFEKLARVWRIYCSSDREHLTVLEAGKKM